MKKILKIYRFFSKGKVSSMRLLLYVGFGLLLSRNFEIKLFTIDLLLVFSGILFASILNDYFDYKYLGELNTVGKMLINKKINEKTVYLYITIPGLIPFLLFYIMWKNHAPPISLLMLLSSFLMSIIYCAPPFRFKEKKIIGLLLPPLGIFLLFIQGVLLGGTPNYLNIIISGNVFLFSWYLEFLHLADDAIAINEHTKVSFNTSLKLAKLIIFIAFVSNLYLAFYFPLIIVSAFFYLYRFLKLRKINETNLSKNRQNLFSGIYHIEEFVIIGTYIIIQKL